MATFTITGTISGIRQRLTWTDGAVDGDEFAVEDVEQLASERVTVGLPGIWNGPAALDTFPAALAVAAAVFDEAFVYEGDDVLVALGGDTPPDAIA